MQSICTLLFLVSTKHLICLLFRTSMVKPKFWLLLCMNVIEYCHCHHHRFWHAIHDCVVPLCQTSTTSSTETGSGPYPLLQAM